MKEPYVFSLLFFQLRHAGHASSLELLSLFAVPNVRPSASSFHPVMRPHDELTNYISKCFFCNIFLSQKWPQWDLCKRSHIFFNKSLPSTALSSGAHFLLAGVGLPQATHFRITKLSTGPSSKLNHRALEPPRLATATSHFERKNNEHI